MKTRSFALLTIALVLSILLTACGPKASPTPQQPAAPKGDAAAGKTKFESTCASCHGPDGKGIPGLGKDLTTSAFAKGMNATDFVAFILQGRPATHPDNTTKVDMPPKGGNPALTESDLYDIVAYARTLQK